MSKYSKEFKLEVVKYYFDHEGLGYLSVSREFNIPSDETVRRWIKKYEAEGESAFNHKSVNQKTKKKKLNPANSGESLSLEEEVKRLRAEVDYLKKLSSLRKG